MIGALQRAWNRMLSIFRRRGLDSDLDAEILQHIDAATEENIARGMPPEEARQRAVARFGGVPQARELHREARGLPALDVLRQDMRFSFRTLWRDRAFAAI